ncbi:MAG: vWA domain-containing protein, partial [Pirellulales bacterium]
LLGVPGDKIPDNATAELLFAYGPRSWGVFVLVGALAAGALVILYLYRREIASCPPWVRVLLAGVRIAVMLLLVTVALGPAVVFTTRQQIDAQVMLAIDASRSIGQKDRYLDDDAAAPVAKARGQSVEELRSSQPTRKAIIEELLTKEEGKLVRDLAAKGKLRVIHFSDQAKLAATKPRYVDPAEREARRKTASNEIVWPHLRWVFYISAIAVVGLAIAGLVTGRAILALVGAVPLAVAFFSITLYLEQNADARPLALMGLGPLDELLYGEQSEDDATPADEVQPETQFDPVLPPVEAVGPTTNYARAIRKALEAASAGPVAAVIVIGDGRNTAGGEDYLKAAAEANERNVPILTVGVGDPSKERRVDVAGVYANDRVWRGDEFEIRAVVKSKGYQGRAVDLTLHEKQVSESGDGKQIERKQGIVLPADDGQQTIVFKHLPEREGEFQYVVKVENVPDPELEGRREDFAPVTVLREQARVLLIAGSPTWEYRMVQTLLTRDKTIDLSCWLQSIKDMPQEGDTKIDHMPSTKEELSAYDVLLLFDPDPSEFRAGGLNRWDTVLREFVSDGGGVLYMTGPKYAGQFLTDDHTEGISDLLPVMF